MRLFSKLVTFISIIINFIHNSCIFHFPGKVAKLPKPGTSMEIPNHNWNHYPRARSGSRLGSHRGRTTRPIWNPASSFDYRSILKPEFKGNTIGKNIRKSVRAKSAPGSFREKPHNLSPIIPAKNRDNYHDFENSGNIQGFVAGKVDGKMNSGEIYQILTKEMTTCQKVCS